MKKVLNIAWTAPVTFLLITCLGMVILASCGEQTTMEQPTESNEVAQGSASEIIWHIKAIHPEGRTINVKAIDANGEIHDVKAIQNSDQYGLMDIKALVGGDRLPIKVLISEDEFSPVKAIAADGGILDIKAITTDGDRLDVKGVRRSGNIIDLKAINKAGEFYGIKAVSPTGQFNDVKGVKMEMEELEATIHGVEVLAHVKALLQLGSGNEGSIWNVKAIHPKGRTIDVKAIDIAGNIFDVKAVQEGDQRHIMDVKALVGKDRLPVKMLMSDDEYAPVKAIATDGAIYDIKAIASDGRRLDVKGVKRINNIIDLKAVAPNGDFYGVKAVSQNGQLNDVKGVKMVKDGPEMEINGVSIYAHVKALPQTR